MFERGTPYERDPPEPVRGGFGVVGVVECGATCVASEAVYFVDGALGRRPSKVVLWLGALGTGTEVHRHMSTW